MFIIAFLLLCLVVLVVLSPIWVMICWAACVANKRCERYQLHH